MLGESGYHHRVQELEGVHTNPHTTAYAMDAWGMNIPPPRQLESSVSGIAFSITVDHLGWNSADDTGPGSPTPRGNVNSAAGIPLLIRLGLVLFPLAGKLDDRKSYVWSKFEDYIVAVV
jgi:hypothetical protein